MAFKQNVGGIDRLIRMVVGIVLLMLAFVGPQSPWGYIGLIPLISGIVGYSFLYAAMKKDTCAWRSNVPPGKKDALI